MANLHPELHWSPARSTDHRRRPLRCPRLAGRAQQRDALVPTHRRRRADRRRRRARCHRGVRGLHASQRPPAPSRSPRATRCAPATAWCCSPPATPTLPGLSRVVVPGADHTRRHRPPAARLGRTGPPRGSRGWDGTRRRRVQRSPAEPRRAHRPSHHVRDRQDDRLPDRRASSSDNGHRSGRTLLLALGALVLAVLVGLTPAWLIRRRRRLRQASTVTGSADRRAGTGEGHRVSRPSDGPRALGRDEVRTGSASRSTSWRSER